MIYSTLSFILSGEALTNSPSRQDGVDEATENQLRQYGCDLIQEAGILLRLPQSVMATGQVLLQRFYCKKSLRKLDVKVASMAAFWLAAKLEEVIEIDSPTKLRLRDVLMVFYRLIRRQENRGLEVLDPYSKKFEEMKAEVVRAERLLLRSFGFIVHVEQPHRFVLSYSQLLDQPRELAQEGWNIANDSLRTTLCVRYKAEVVACGILFLAARRLKMPMPESPPWWEAFGASQEQVHTVCSILLELYSRPKAQYVSLGRDVTSRAKQPGMPSPKTANATPLMRSPAPEVSTAAASGAVAAADGGKGEAVQKGEGGKAGSDDGGASVANGVANGKDGKAASRREGDGGAGSPGSSPGRPAGREPREQQQQPSGSQAAAGRQRSRSRSGSRETGRKRSRSPDRREQHKHSRHRHDSRGDSRDRRRDYDPRHGGSSRRAHRDDRDRSDRRREERDRDRERDRHRPSTSRR